MLKPDDLHAMKPEDQTQLFERLAVLHYGTDRYAVAASHDFDVARPTIFRWKREHITPFSVILLLQEWTTGGDRNATVRRELENLVRLQIEIRNALEAIAKSVKPAAPGES